jgi:hypothetical protein
LIYDLLGGGFLHSEKIISNIQKLFCEFEEYINSLEKNFIESFEDH